MIYKFYSILIYKMESSDLVSKRKEENNQIKSKNIFNNLKADYFLQKVFNNLERKRTLYFVKYNKAIKNRVNINIKDYKEYSELIEIEIKPVNNKYGKFINIKKKRRRIFSYIF